MATQILEQDRYRRAAQRLAMAIDAERDTSALVSEVEALTGNRRSLGH